MIEFHLSAIPPSANRIWRSDRGGRPHKSDKYRKWLHDAGWEVKQQLLGSKITGPYKLSIQIKRPDKRRRDLDNFSTKAISDLLVMLGVIEDDSLAEMISARWVSEGATVTVRVESAGAVSNGR